MEHNYFFDLSKCGIVLPTTPLLSAALKYTEQHTSPTTVNHCLRCAAYALLLINKNSGFSTADKELIVFASIFHDLGWATTTSMLSKDKRFEVDGANIGRQWILENGAKLGWSGRQLQLLWDAIALHTTPSIAQHKELEVLLVHLGITADFVGPNMPHGMISIEEHKEIVSAFPRLGFRDEVKKIMCNLCAAKPETTYDNFVKEFGVKYGLDGEGGGKDAFALQVEENLSVNKLMGALKSCEPYEN